MGICQDKIIKKHKIQNINPSYQRVAPAVPAIKQNWRPQSFQKLHHLPFMHNDTHLAYPFNCFGYILSDRGNYIKIEEQDILGVGCLVGDNLILSSDHVLDNYQVNQLSFSVTLGSELNEKIKIKTCIFQTNKCKHKKKSYFFNNQLNIVILQLQNEPKQKCKIDIGLGMSQIIAVLAEDSDQYELMSCDSSNVLQQSKHHLISQAFLYTKQIGIPLIYELYNHYYLIGLQTNHHHGQELLFTRQLFNQIKNQTNYSTLSVFEINKAYMRMPEIINIIDSSTTNSQNQIQSIAQSNSGSLQQAQNLFDLGIKYGRGGKFKQQLECYQRSISLYIKWQGDNCQNVAYLYHNIGVCLSELGLFQQSQKYLMLSLQLKKQLFISDSEQIGDTLHELGVLFRLSNNKQQSLNYYIKARLIYQNNQLAEKQAIVNTNLILLQQTKNNEQMSIQKYTNILIKNSIKSTGKRIVSLEIGVLLFHIGKLLGQRQELGESLNYLANSFQIFINLNYTPTKHIHCVIAAIQNIHTNIQQSKGPKQLQLKSNQLVSKVKQIYRNRCSSQFL